MLELMIALAIFMLLVAVLVGFGRQVTQSWGRLHREQQRFAELLVLDRTLDTILTNVVPFSWKDDENEDVSVFLGESDRLRVTYLHRLNEVADGAIRFVELALEEGCLVAYYRQRPFWDLEDVRDSVKKSVLAEEAQAVSFQYADWTEEDELDWLDEWDEEREDLPLAVLITVEWEDGRSESWLRRTAGSGYRERWGKWHPKSLEDAL